MRVKNYLGLKNKWITLFFLSICFIGNAQTPDASNTLYVNINVVGGTGDGSSWANAIPQLSDAMKYARAQFIADATVYDATSLKIYVAKGTYKPMYSPQNSMYTQDDGMNNAFVIVKNVQIYGGFDPNNGIDDLTDTRIFDENGSILSGDIGNSPLYEYDDAYHVVISAGAVGTALLDGFTIRDAFMDYLGSNLTITVNTYPVYRARGAIYNVLSSPIFANCIITDNRKWVAGGMYNYYQSSPTITNCTFKSNYTYYTEGGAIYNYYQSSPTITNCSFTNNAAIKGGAIYNENNSSPVISNCSFTINAANEGGAIYNEASSPVIINTLFANNEASHIGSPTNGSAIYNEGASSPSLTNVTIANNTGLNAIYSEAGSTLVVNSIIYGTILGTYTPQYSLIEGNAGGTNGNLDGTVITKDDVFTNASGGDYTLFPCSAVADKGSNSLFTGLNGSTKDLAGNARVYDFSGGGIIDLGAYESQPIVPDANGNVYVTTTGAGTRNGNSWSNATSKLQCAIDAVGAQKVLVSTGNYNVGSSSYVMKNNVEIYGGFDPANGIDDLSDTRILPNPVANTEGSVLNGLNTRPLIWNFNNGVNSSAVLDGFTLKNGHSVNGGAIHSRSVSPTFRNLWIKNNTASADGGAIYNENSVSSVISNVTIENNTASYGSGMFNKNGSSPTLNNVIIRNNTANNDGGAMYNDVSASPLMTNVTITGNTAKNGAGIYNRTNSAPVLVNTLIANNTANTNGGAIRNEATSSPTLTNVTIANNSGSNAIYATDGNTTLNNSIVFGTASASYTAQNSLIEGNAGGTNGNLNGTTVTKADVFTDNANKDYTLKSTAVAVDAGNNTLFAGLNASTKDLAGNARVYNFATAGVIDLGALESNYVRIFPDANGIMYVRENYNGNGASWEHATGSLQGAIDGTGTQKVFVANGNYNAPTNSFVMKNNVEIYGSFDPDNNIKTLSDSRNMPSLSHGGSILNGQNARRVVFNNFTSGSPLNATAVLDGFTISSGNSTFGSGMYNVYAGPTLRNLVVKNNTATTSGGGIATEYASPTLTNVIISGNAVTTTGAGRGGGMYNYQSNITLQNVIIDNNTVSTTTQNGFGGGMYNVNNAPTFTNVSITNNAVISSSATAVGGGMFNNNTTPTLTNVTIANNRANVGGGITNQSTTISIYNSIFWGNQRSGSTSVAGADIQNGTVTLKNSITQVFTTGNATDNNLVGIDPLFVSPTDFRPQEISPAVDGGDNSFFVGLDASTLDLAGNARVYNFAGGGIIDMGAYEIGAKISPLPITLTSFSGSCDDNGIQLSWTTASESNVSHFEIYRSRNGQNWEEVSEIVAVGNSSTSNSYQAIDAKGIETMYYKLRSVDNDGSYQDFNPISIMCNNVNENTWNIYPVPVKNELFVQTQAEQNGVYTLFITDVFGKLVYEKQIDVEVGTNRFAIKTNDLENGTYIIYLNDGITTKLRKFVKVD